MAQNDPTDAANGEQATTDETARRLLMAQAAVSTLKLSNQDTANGNISSSLALNASTSRSTVISSRRSVDITAKFRESASGS